MGEHALAQGEDDLLGCDAHEPRRREREHRRAHRRRDEQRDRPRQRPGVAVDGPRDAGVEGIGDEEGTDDERDRCGHDDDEEEHRHRQVRADERVEQGPRLPRDVRRRRLDLVVLSRLRRTHASRPSRDRSARPGRSAVRAGAVPRRGGRPGSPRRGARLHPRPHELPVERGGLEELLVGAAGDDAAPRRGRRRRRRGAVEGRWAMMSVVESGRISRRASRTRSSVSTSTAESGSSRTRIRGLPMTARASASAPRARRTATDPARRPVCRGPRAGGRRSRRPP